MSILEKLLSGDIRTLSRLISIVENRSGGYREILARMYRQAGRSVRIGITGPPGAGKSTLVNGLAKRVLDEGKKVGIIAVDPTSPFTGGALLGDRVRMNEFPTDGSFYFRSMATRGATGGLAAATGNVSLIYDSFGFDITFVETVGVGQVELDIVDTCDSVVVVLVPESGDAVQTMKAGLMEIADLFCVNKADRPGSERMVAELHQMLDTRRKDETVWEVPVISTEAVTGKNIDRVYAAISEHIEFIKTTGLFETHRREQIKKKVLSILKSRFEQEFIDRVVSQVKFDRIVDDIQAGKNSPFEIGDQLYDEFSGR